MNFFTFKKQRQAAPIQQAAILQHEDGHKFFDAIAIKRSLEIAATAAAITQGERNRPYNIQQADKFDSLAVHKPILDGLVTVFGTQSSDPQWLELCKQSICDTLKDQEVHKHYLITGIVKEYLPFKKSIDILFGSSFALLTPSEVATVIDSINYQTGENTEHLQAIIHSRQTKDRTDNRTTYLGILTVAQVAKHPKAKEALLHSIPANFAPKLALMFYDTIKQTPQENQQALIEKFFFKKDSTMNIRILIKEIKEQQGINEVAALMVLLDELYGVDELQQKEPGLDDYISSLS